MMIDSFGVEAVPQSGSVVVSSPVAFSIGQEGEQGLCWDSGDGGFSPEASGAVPVLQSQQLDPGDLLCCLDDPLQGFSVCSQYAFSAAAVC